MKPLVQDCGARNDKWLPPRVRPPGVPSDVIRIRQTDSNGSSFCFSNRILGVIKLRDFYLFVTRT